MFGESAMILGAPLLAAMTVLPVAYVVCLIVGGGLLLVSTVFGGDADAGVDGAIDVDADLDVDLDAAGGDAPAVDGAAGGGAWLAEWFSIHFAVYFLAMFGVVGTVLSYMTSVSALVVLAVSIGSGLLVGQGMHQVLRYLRRTSGGRTISGKDYLGKAARVTIAIAAGKRGEVAVQVRDRERFVAATAKHPDVRFEVGDRVVVIAYANGVAEVISRDEHEFLNEP